MTTTTPSPDIDNVDMAILTLINNAKRPLWKNRIHEQLHEQQETLPITNGISVQTVGRRVDTLQENNYLETVISSPEDLKRDLIIAFKLTDEGHNVLHVKRDELLKGMVHTTLFTSDKRTDIGKEALVAIINDHFGTDDVNELVPEEHEECELLSLLALHYAEQEALTIFDTEDSETLYKTVPHNTVLPVPSRE